MPHTGSTKYRTYSLNLAFWLALVFMTAFPFLGVSPASAGPKTQATLYKFSGETLKVPYQWDTVNCQSVRSQLFWHQSAHTSPVGKVLFSQCNEDLQWKLPKPDQPADYELVVEVFSQDRWNNADAIQIKVFPRNLMNPLRNWAKNNTLMVADNLGKLDAVLKYFKIPYEKTFGFEPPSPQAIMKVGLREYVFLEATSPLPKVWVKEDRVEFEMKILDDLPNNPLLQSELMRIMEDDLKVDFHPITNAKDILTE